MEKVSAENRGSEVTLVTIGAQNLSDKVGQEFTTYKISIRNYERLPKYIKNRAI